MEKLDLAIRGGSVVLPDEVRRMDVGIRAGRIAKLGDIAADEAKEAVDARGLHVMAGMIDVHVHLNEPGLGDWEGFESGSAALAAGGCAAYLDMPLNGIPPTVTVRALERKLAAAKGRSVVDYGCWGGLVPGRLDELEPLAAAGVVGFKAFMSAPGDPSEEAFREVDDATLLEGMKRIARLGKVLALHAESEPIVARLTAEARERLRSRPGGGKFVGGEFRVGTSAADYSATRPVEAELEAVRRALRFARETGCPLHFVHISSAAAVAAIRAAKEEGMDVTLETCPHYLTLTEDDLGRLGSVAKCAPPLRSEAERDRLWEEIRAGRIDMISSDHSPCPTSMKTGDLLEAWGGISGAQSSLELMIDEGVGRRGLTLPQISRLLSSAPAKRFGLYPDKGEIAVGSHADLALVDLSAGYTLEAGDLYYRHKHSPYVGRSFSCRVAATYSRGRLVYRLGEGVFPAVAEEAAGAAGPEGAAGAGQWLRAGGRPVAAPGFRDDRAARGRSL
ncbi:allantoinase [Cohnella xylanilytica]|uniref:allantoinase AllB n=1 Tax=Cohnella xylanilytica TaxID=557555 RepID=UPI001B24D355|nr:allantoinase AllB [Cohnella xylanilytica]GIO11196.1 allantoinase [Cohnella xylanilytica]